MLPAVVKLCCGITYPHLRSMAGLQRTAIAAIGQELAHVRQGGTISLPDWPSHIGWPWNTDSRGEFLHQCFELSYVQQGQEALRKALEIVEDKNGWKTETIQENGDVIYSKVLPGGRKVFRLEAVLEASPEVLCDVLFVRVEEMCRWNPSISHIKVLRSVGAETMVTHEVTAETAGNLIGQRDFLSVRHCCKQKSRIYLAGAATHLESFMPQRGFVRAEDGPTCIILQAVDDGSRRSRFTWLLNMDVKGWLPKSIVNQALPRAQADFTKHLRRRLTVTPMQR
uniref:START domain-containing protein 1 n=1 Tax=Denticeps clupeoides TaxID=299321 RepID=A0AAY3ZZ00_9TELE